VSKYPNSGTLSKNERKREGKNDPDYSGSAEVDGAAYWLSAWVKAGQNGKFLSLSFRPKEEPKRPPVEDEGPEGFDDDLPF